MFLLTLKLYLTIGRAVNGEGSVAYYGVHLSPVGAAFLAALMVLLGGFTRLGSDDVWDIRTCGPAGSKACVVNFLGLVALVGSLACLLLLQIDLWAASAWLPNRELLTSFFVVWLGYPIVFVFAIVWRSCFSAPLSSGAKKSMFPERLSVLKDICYGGLDFWAKGVFALYTAFNVFGLSLFRSDAMTF